MDVIKSEDEWWWIDFIENELDPMLDRDLQTLLEQSQEDRDTFETFRLLKYWLKDSDPIAGWPIEERLERMRARVMQAVNAPESEPKREHGTSRGAEIQL